MDRAFSRVSYLSRNGVLDSGCAYSFFLIPLKGVIVSAIDEGGWSRMVSRLRVILRRAFKAT